MRMLRHIFSSGRKILERMREETSMSEGDLAHIPAAKAQTLPMAEWTDQTAATGGGHIAGNKTALESGDYPRLLHAWYLVLVLFLVTLFASVDRQILALLAQPIKHDLN